MTATEAVKILAYLAHRCPSMRIEDGTAAAWFHGDLEHHEFNDALEAAMRLTRRQNYVSLAELLAECGSVQRERLGKARVAELEAQIATENPPLQLHGRPVSAIAVGQQVPKARMLAQAVNAGKKPASAVDTKAAAAEQSRREHARAELEQARQKAASE